MIRPWWGTQDLATGQLVRWRIAGLSLWVRRAQREWKVAWDWPAEWEESLIEVERENDAEQPDEAGLNVERHVLSQPGPELRFLPVTADRAVVTTPRIPFYLGPHDETRLFVGSPLWIRVTTEEGEPLREIPIHRPTDTFFGPSTLEGEVCYATRSRASLERENLEWSARRAVTPIQIRNESSEALAVERLKIPVTLLSVFAAGPRLWTESIEVAVGEEEEVAAVEIRPGPPSEAAGAELLSEPRSDREDSGLLMKVFDNLATLSRKF